MLKKSAVPVPPPLARETVNVPELGGDVLVQGLLLSDKLEAAIADNGFSRVAITLSRCVMVDDGKSGTVPLFTKEEWERWGSANYVAAMNLWGRIDALSDNSGKLAEKKSDAQRSDSPAA